MQRALFWQDVCLPMATKRHLYGDLNNSPKARENNTWPTHVLREE